MDVVRNFLTRYEQTREEEFSIEEYLEACKRNPLVYATAAERILAAIGEPELLDTRHDQRLSRLFGNKVIKIYPAFRDFYGLEDPIEQVVSYFRHAAQGLEEKKTDTVSARACGWRQVLDRRAAQTADGAGAFLCAEGLARQ